MHERLYSFLEKEQLLFEGQFGFRNNRSTTDALIDITERIRNACDKGLYACGAFLDFKKAFDTVNHDILLSKLAHYRIRGQANNWFHSYLTQRVQFISLNRFNSRLHLISHGVPQGSVLGPLLFIIFINDLHKSIRHSQMLHFADDTNLLYINKSMKRINKHINHDLSLIVQWLRSNKISLNADKTELVIFSPKRKQITKHLNFRISGQKIEISTRVKYLGIQIDQHLNWNEHIKNIIPKLSRAIGVLSKICHYVPKFLLKTIYYSIFNSHLIYACQVWGQNENCLKKLSSLQNKAIRIINFKQQDFPINELYYANGILKIKDYIHLINFLFVRDVLSNESLEVFSNYFTKSDDFHDHMTRHSSRHSIIMEHSNTLLYGFSSIRNKAASSWNFLQSKLNTGVTSESHNKAKKC